MIVEHSNEAILTPKNSETTPRALIVGGGVPAMIAAHALMEIGIEATFARFRDTPEHVYFADPVIDPDSYIKELSLKLTGTEIIDVSSAPVVRRGQGVFKVEFDNGTESVYDCLFLAPGISLKPKPIGLPDEAELFSSLISIQPEEQVVFLADYKELTDPALAMSAIRVAADHVRNGGAAVVCFRHAPVLHAFGEKLYDSARKTGLQFIRYGEELPAIEVVDDKQSKRFRIALKDVIDDENQFVWDCNRLVAITGPDPSSLPKWSSRMASADLDGQGFLLSDSIHSISGRSVASGVFVIGEGTGNLDSISCLTQAKATVAQAQAWIGTTRLKRDQENLSVSTACVRCLTCYRVCPHGALSLRPQASRSQIEPSQSFCVECGICASVCPSAAISLSACPQESITGFIKGVQPSEMPKTTFVFGCRRSAGTIAESINMPGNVSFFPVPCAGSVSEYSIWSALAAGAKGVLVIGCHHGNCYSHAGTGLAAARVERGKGIGLFDGKPPRIGYFTVAANESARFQRLLNQFLDDETL
jgi:quinone-modifying oxidoreductase, subunit QmoB